MSALGLDAATLVGNDSGGAVSQMFTAALPRARPPARPHQLRHARELPAEAVQPDAPAGAHPGRDVSLMAQPFRHRRRCGGLGSSPFAKKKIDPRAGRLLAGAHAGRRRRARDAGHFMAGAKQEPDAGGGEEARVLRVTGAAGLGPGGQVLPAVLRRAAARRLPDARIVEVPGAGTFVALDQPERVADAIRDFVIDRLTIRHLNWPRSNPREPRPIRKSRHFSAPFLALRLTRPPSFRRPGMQLGRQMADLFDQNEPKSALARSLNDAFAGIDGWSVSPPRRRSTLPDEPTRSPDPPGLGDSPRRSRLGAGRTARSGLGPRSPGRAARRRPRAASGGRPWR